MTYATPTHTHFAAPSYPGGSAGQSLVAEAIGCILAGRPLPEAVRPAAQPAAATATIEEGISRILAGSRR